MKTTIVCVALGAALMAAPAFAQKLGAGGTAIDGTQALPRCSTSIGTIALVEQKKEVQQNLPPQFQALMEMAARQQGGAANVDPLPLIKLLINQSGCFNLLERGTALEALQRERALSGAAATSQLQSAKYLMTAEVVYQDVKAGGGGGLGGLGNPFLGGGIKVNNLETQILLTLVEVDTGLQRAVSSGSARKKDIGLLGAGLVGAGAAALTGYQSTDVGKITAAAILDAYRKMMPSIQALEPAPAQQAQTSPPSAQTLPQ